MRGRKDMPGEARWIERHEKAPEWASGLGSRLQKDLQLAQRRRRERRRAANDVLQTTAAAAAER